MTLTASSLSSLSFSFSVLQFGIRGKKNQLHRKQKAGKSVLCWLKVVGSQFWLWECHLSTPQQKHVYKVRLQHAVQAIYRSYSSHVFHQDTKKRGLSVFSLSLSLSWPPPSLALKPAVNTLFVYPQDSLEMSWVGTVTSFCGFSVTVEDIAFHFSHWAVLASCSYRCDEVGKLIRCAKEAIKRTQHLIMLTTHNSSPHHGTQGTNVLLRSGKSERGPHLAFLQHLALSQTARYLLEVKWTLCRIWI